jgi:SAM-dependent methyltransferase
LQQLFSSLKKMEQAVVLETDKGDVVSSNDASVINENIRYTGAWWKNQQGLRSFFSYTERFHSNDCIRAIHQFPPSGNRIIDIGFGGGILLGKIWRILGRTSALIGLDLSAETVGQYNRRRAKSNRRGLFALQADPFRSLLPFKTASMDYIFCSHVLEHVADDILLEQEIHRVLKKTGIACILIPINEERCEVPTHVRKYVAEAFVERLDKSFNILHSHYNDCVSGWIRFCGTRNRAVFTVLKRIIILKASLIPFSLMVSLDNLLMKAGCLPSQMCIVCRKRC